ncbi:MAG TPA: glycosyl transferase, partial [Eubacterium sp.]|nr:glycosyl transferase [Eubacterium sp.]
RPMDTPVRCSKYMAHYLDMMMCVSSILCILSGEDENLKKKEELWNHLKEKDIKLYKKLRHSFLGIGMNLPGKAGRSLSVKGYKVMQKIFKFN